MMIRIVLQVCLLTLVTTAAVIREDEDNSDVARLVNNVEPTNNITCLCTANEICDAGTTTCRLTHQDHRCYHSWTVEPSDHSIVLSAGCVYNDYPLMQFFCAANLTTQVIVCCSQRDYCNDLDAYSKEIRHSLLAPTKSGISSVTKASDSFPTLLIIIVFTTLAIILILVGVAYFVVQQNKTAGTKRRPYPSDGKATNKIQRLWERVLAWRSSKSDRQSSLQEVQSLEGLLEMSISTTEPALPRLIQRTLAREIDLEKEIGTGRYGTVHRGKWREDFVAVKIFSSSDERSWFREIDIYQTVCLRHENILGYIAADNMDASTYTQLWLVTEYHENGSLYDYLMSNTVTLPTLIKMMLSIASGLCHLHMPIDSTNGKVALAHRDLKSKNILVKKDLSCCIADLGLAVKEIRHPPKSLARQGQGADGEHVVIDIETNNRVGTQRYMAPEVLDQTINARSFESFKAADIYSLGLVYWEILRRCNTSRHDNDADSFQVPYEDILPNNPTVAQMLEIVCVRKLRPTLSARWQAPPVFRNIVRLCEELWAADPRCRLNSLNAKRHLKSQLSLVENDQSIADIDFRQQPTPTDGPYTN